MSLEKKPKLSLIQRIKRLILGKERPNIFTRVSVWAGFLVWIYLVSWQILTLLSLFLMDSLKQAELVEKSFIRVGSKLYGYADTVNLLMIHTLLQLIAFGIILFGLILIWRKKRLGFLLYVIGNVLILLITVFVLGMKYFRSEMTYVDLVLIGVSTLYFGIGALWLYRSKGNKKENELKAA
jgi:hypothetical protein